LHGTGLDHPKRGAARAVSRSWTGWDAVDWVSGRPRTRRAGKSAARLLGAALGYDGEHLWGWCAAFAALLAASAAARGDALLAPCR
jgi:hypothetical protein